MPNSEMTWEDLRTAVEGFAIEVRRLIEEMPNPEDEDKTISCPEYDVNLNYYFDGDRWCEILEVSVEPPQCFGGRLKGDQVATLNVIAEHHGLQGEIGHGGEFCIEVGAWQDENKDRDCV